jgi:hypothetical protein
LPAKTPNPSLNVDVPHAGLRPRIGPPVSLIGRRCWRRIERAENAMSYFVLFFISLLSTLLALAPPQFTGRRSLDAICSLP